MCLLAGWLTTVVQYFDLSSQGSSKIAVEYSFARAHPPPTKVPICQKPTLEAQKLYWLAYFRQWHFWRGVGLKNSVQGVKNEKTAWMREMTFVCYAWKAWIFCVNLWKCGKSGCNDLFLSNLCAIAWNPWLRGNEVNVRAGRTPGGSILHEHVSLARSLRLQGLK